MKKILSGFYVLLLAFALLLVGCGKTKENNNFMNLSSDTDIVAFSAISSASVLSDSYDTDLLYNSSYHTSSLSTVANEEIDIDKVNQYVQLFESVASGSPILSEEVTSDNENYEIKIIYKVTDLAGVTTEYTIYYNLVLIEKDGDMDLEDQFEDYLKGEKGKSNGKISDIEEEYLIDGIAVIGEDTYQIKGKKEQEDDEMELAIKIVLDEKNYVNIQQENEDDESEYSYKVIKDGKKYLEIQMESEEKDSEYELQFSTYDNNVKEQYKFEREIINDKTVLVIQHIKGSKKLTIVVSTKIDSETNEIEYEYFVKEKNEKHYYNKGIK